MAYVITTKYLGPTDTKGARIKATYAGAPHPAVIVPYDHNLNSADAHMQAAVLLARRLKAWNGVSVEMTYGSTKDGYVFVLMQDVFRV